MSSSKWLNDPEPLSEGTAVPASESDSLAAHVGGVDPEGSLEDAVVAALKSVFDPEIPVNIYDLGLIYGLSIDHESAHVDIEMTLTAPGCPVAQTFPGEVERRVMEVPGVASAKVELVWEPPWTRDRMSEAAQLTLGML
jgi:FeS assembly SUF system protein